MWISKASSEPYLNGIVKALENEQLFQTFKSQPSFQTVVGVSESFHAVNSYKTISKHPEVFRNLSKFIKNDSIGAPFKIWVLDEIHNRIQVGCDTLRFIESVCYISDTFNNLNGFSIMEFGSNYGGLCFCLQTQFQNIESYSLTDFPIIQQLSLAYLQRLNINLERISTALPTQPVDLFIAEYSLTEQTEKEMYDLYNQYGATAKRGVFIRCNLHNAEREQKFLHTLSKTFAIRVIPEPMVRRPNKIVIGVRNI